jgi:hypothetical protein
LAHPCAHSVATTNDTMALVDGWQPPQLTLERWCPERRMPGSRGDAPAAPGLSDSESGDAILKSSTLNCRRLPSKS